MLLYAKCHTRTDSLSRQTDLEAQLTTLRTALDNSLTGGVVKFGKGDTNMTFLSPEYYDKRIREIEFEIAIIKNNNMTGGCRV